MSALALVLAGVALVALVAWRMRPPPRRVASLVPQAPDPARPPRWRRRLVWVGRGVALAVAVVVWPPGVVVAAGWWLVAPKLRAVREAKRRRATVVVGLPDAIDLLVLVVGAGRTVPLAVASLAGLAPAPIGDAFAEVDRRRQRGQPLADALAALPEQLGPPAQPLAGALVATERYGVPLGRTLEQLALDARRERRRQAEVAARKLPVRLSFPLVCCILPAFGLLTLAPLLAGALRSLQV